MAGPTAAGGPATTRLILQKGFGGNDYICSDMVNHQDIAEKYAKEHGCDIVEPAARRGGYSYFTSTITAVPIIQDIRTSSG